MNKQLFDIMKSTGGMYIPLFPDAGNQQNLRYEYGSGAAEFPSYLKKESTENNRNRKTN
jgi:N-acetylglucosamine-6-sulfatase